MRTESDLLGSVELPADVLYGVQTLRGIENFRISKFHLNEYPLFIKGLAVTKLGAAEANHKLGLLTDEKFNAIAQACREIMDGKHHDAFPVDMIQGGAGTTTNMNANEVIANRALEIMGHQYGEYQYCSPNDDVNCAQSTNDAYPTAIHLGMYATHLKLVEHLKQLIESFEKKAAEFADVLKMGRTQLQDAVPMTLGQEFEAYAATLTEEIDRLQTNLRLFYEINMGATAIGTGINADPDYAELCTKHLREITGLPLSKATNMIEATSDTGAFIMNSSALKRLAVKLSKICNDLRLLSSGPRCGLNEINLPPRQPGSSIMPGKVNPVIPEVVNQVAFRVIGNDLTITLASEAGQLELNVMEPIIAFSLSNGIHRLRLCQHPTDAAFVRQIIRQAAQRGVRVNQAHHYHRPSSRRSRKSRPGLRGPCGLSTIPAAAYCRIGSDGSTPPAQRLRPAIGVLLLLPQKRVLSPCTRQF